MPKYDIVITQPGGKQIIRRTDPDGTEWYIPNDPMNADFMAYQAWLAAQDEGAAAPAPVP